MTHQKEKLHNRTDAICAIGLFLLYMYFIYLEEFMLYLLKDVTILFV